MRNGKRRIMWITMVCLAVLFCTAMQAAAAAGGSPYDRRQAISDEQWALGSLSRVGASEKAWQKINGVCYNGSGVKIPGAITRGIDVSEWQGPINWQKVKKSDVDFAMIRISHSLTHPDTQYAANMKGANAAGVPVGTYIYSAATTPEEALKEAQYAITKMKGYKISYPVVYDMEDAAIEALPRAKKTELAVTFLTEIKKAGYYPMLYTNANWYKNILDMKSLSGYDVWLAWFGDTINRPDPSVYKYTIWQATGGDIDAGMMSTRGMIDGISPSSNADINFGFVDYTKKITPRTAPLSTYKPASAPEKKNGWAEEDGKTYYYRNGVKVKGAQKIDGKEYRFSGSDCHLFKNALLYSSATKAVVYVDKNGVVAKSKWVTFKGKKYYFGKDGYALKGSRCIGGKYYLFAKTKGYAYTNYKVMNSKGDIYYYGKDGARVNTGFTKIVENGKTNTYYFNRKGVAYKGWHTIGGKKYYFLGGRGKTAGVRVEGKTMIIKGEKCTFNKTGVCIKRVPV